MRRGEIKKCDIGKKERTARIVLGLALIDAGILAGSGWGALGLIPFVTGVRDRCPVYRVFGISTCSKKREIADESRFSGYSVG